MHKYTSSACRTLKYLETKFQLPGQYEKFQKRFRKMPEIANLTAVIMVKIDFEIILSDLKNPYIEIFTESCENIKHCQFDSCVTVDRCHHGENGFQNHFQRP